MKAKVACALLTLLVAWAFPPCVAAIDLYFEKAIHDPSTIQKDNGRHWTFGTGDGVVSRYSDDLLSWQIGDPVFPAGTWPAWINDYVSNFDGSFWAPDVIYMNGKYYLYYSCYGSINGGTGFESAIGVAVTTSLNSPSWTDLGVVVSSKTEPKTPQGEPINTIDAGLFRDAGGNVWMAYGSHYGGIFVLQIDPSTGKRLNSTRYPVVGNGGAWNEYEGAQVTYVNSYYYMFVNLGECCAGDDSTYYIVVGRSTSPTGPYVDQTGKNLWNYGGTTLLASEGKYIGPGHYGYYNNGGQHLVSIHYYDGTTADGWPAKLDLLQMSFSNGWPVLTRNFTISGASPPPSMMANLSDGARFTITARHSGKLVEVRDRQGGCSSSGIGDGTNVRQMAANGSTCQQWVAKRMRDKYGSIDPYYWTFHPAPNEAQAMDIYNFSQLDGGNISTWTFFNNEAQHYRLVDLGNGYYHILARASGKVLNVDDGSTADGANVEQWRAMGWTSQQFVFTAAGGGGGGTATTMYVAEVVTGTENAGGGKKRGTATVTIKDNLGNPVGGATVTGTFSGSFSETKSGTTGSDGKAVLKTTATKSGTVTLTFCVDSVTHGSLTYDSSKNVMTCDGL
ncbi:MAG: RICIN domain-containing protein [Acidobacteria bacterium]|nr:RICIN domain-containing protein [Acidobacteriota bacterium]